MAKVQFIGDLNSIIQNCVGVLDYYYWKGILVVRSWPVRRVAFTPRELQNQQKFARAVRAYNMLTDEERAFWRAKAGGSRRSGRDLFLKWYMKYGE